MKNLLLAAASFALVCPHAFGADNQLYGVTSCCPNNFVEIDPSTGVQTVLSAVGDVGFGFPVGVSAIDVANNTYFIARNDMMGDPHILSIDTDTGAFVESPVLSDGLIQLGFDQDDGVLFGITVCCPNRFVHVNLGTGALTDIAMVGDASFGFASGANGTDSAGDRFFVSRSFMGDTFVAAIDTQTGVVTESTMPVTSGLIKLIYDEDDSLLAGLTVCCPNEYVHINQVTGAFASISNIGDMNFAFATGASAIDTAGSRFFMHRRNDLTGGSDHIISVDTATGVLTESGAMVKSVFSLGYDEPVNQAPTADAGPDQTIECSSPAGTMVSLSGAGSSDPDGDVLTFTWTGPFPEGGGTVMGSAQSVTLPPGVHTITLTVDDGNGGMDSDDVEITIEDTTPPSLSVSLSPDTLWPPNHKMKTITATITEGDSCSAVVSIELLSVVSNEPDNAPGGGDGNTVNDIQGADTGTDDREFQVRAERSGQGSGRIYTATYKATDGSGNMTTESATVTVPHNP